MLISLHSIDHCMKVVSYIKLYLQGVLTLKIHGTFTPTVHLVRFKKGVFPLYHVVSCLVAGSRCCFAPL